VNELDPQVDGPEFGIPGLRWTRTGLEFTQDISYSDYESVGWVLSRVFDASKWSLGDWLCYGEARFPGRYAQAASVTGRSVGGLMNLASVSRRVPHEVRREALSWSHHEAVAALLPEQQSVWLDRSEKERLSVEELRGLLRPAADLTTSLGLGSPPDPDMDEVTKALAAPRSTSATGDWRAAVLEAEARLWALVAACLSVCDELEAGGQALERARAAGAEDEVVRIAVRRAGRAATLYNLSVEMRLLAARVAGELEEAAS
jgi:hypothetical protein